jgi:hypothetical protein
MAPGSSGTGDFLRHFGRWIQGLALELHDTTQMSS